MLRGAQAGRSIYLSKALGDPVFEQRLLIARQWSDPKRKLTIRSRSLPAARAALIPLRMPFEHMTNSTRGVPESSGPEGEECAEFNEFR
ncbi:hypothetical protein GCM10017668_63040 [Streptomyces tuirus]|uniref:Uncharacterized protein n=1 Tax=Streptomyces tuirus TaxID=68278 RepID=A0A7G1NPI8_9ACTN|nr:hypothetical protein GCM10017668_63040 [Streptomyces tuirus]